MVLRKASIFDMAKAIKQEVKKPYKDYGSGLLGEHLIVSSYKVATTKDLKAMRYLINKVLEERIIQKRIQDKQFKEIKLKKDESNLNPSHSSGNV